MAAMRTWICSWAPGSPHIAVSDANTDTVNVRNRIAINTSLPGSIQQTGLANTFRTDHSKRPTVIALCKELLAQRAVVEHGKVRRIAASGTCCNFHSSIPFWLFTNRRVDVGCRPSFRLERLRICQVPTAGSRSRIPAPAPRRRLHRLANYRVRQGRWRLALQNRSDAALSSPAPFPRAWQILRDSPQVASPGTSPIVGLGGRQPSSHSLRFRHAR